MDVPLRALFWLGLLLLSIRFVGLAMEVGWRLLLPYDAWAQWATKSRVWFEFGRIVPFVLPDAWLRSGDPMAFMDMHSNYPGTVPLLQVWTDLCLGRWDESLMNAPWLALFATLGLAFYAQLRRTAIAPWRAMIYTYFLLSLPFLDIHVALAGVADVFVAATYGLAAIALWQWTLRRERIDLVLALVVDARARGTGRVPPARRSDRDCRGRRDDAALPGRRSGHARSIRLRIAHGVSQRVGAAAGTSVRDG
jgi:hypothetical protein